jgi:hypothetical protein
MYVYLVCVCVRACACVCVGEWVGGCVCAPVWLCIRMCVCVCVLYIYCVDAATETVSAE